MSYAQVIFKNQYKRVNYIILRAKSPIEIDKVKIFAECLRNL